jgi:beta-phosphoglucomutase family hydrolase
MNREPEARVDEPAAKPTRFGLSSEIRACLFDLDGVLTRTATLHAAAWKQAFDGFLQQRSRTVAEPFAPFDPIVDYERYVDGKRRLDGVRSFLDSRGIHLAEGRPEDPPEADTVHGLAERKDEIFVQLLLHTRVETFEGSVRYVRAVRQARLRTAVVSSSKHCRQVLASAGIADLFDVVVDGAFAETEHLAGKPAPDTYLAAARILGVTPAGAAVFEDALAGVESGRAGGFGCVVGVDRLGQADELRRHGADVVVSDLATLLERA